MHVEAGEDGGAAAHERGGVFVFDRRGDAEVGFVLDGVGGEGALVGVFGGAVHDARGAEGLFTRETLLAVAVGVEDVTSANVVSAGEWECQLALFGVGGWLRRWPTLLEF